MNDIGPSPALTATGLVGTLVYLLWFAILLGAGPGFLISAGLVTYLRVSGRPTRDKVLGWGSYVVLLGLIVATTGAIGIGDPSQWWLDLAPSIVIVTVVVVLGWLPWVRRVGAVTARGRIAVGALYVCTFTLMLGAFEALR